MTIRDILVCQAEDIHAESRLRYAMALAQAFEARLTAAYVQQEFSMPSYVEAELPREIRQRRHQEMKQQAEQRRDAFVLAAERAGLKAEFRVMEGDPAQSVAVQARYADLVVAGQPDPDNPAPQDGLGESLLFSAGRPVVFVPYAGTFSGAPKRITVAWNASRESARAVHDAMPLLERAKEVVVLEIDPEDQSSGAEMAAHLARHGIKATARHTVAGDDITVAEAILSAVSDDGTELLVMGCYGHSRLREWVLGGATHEILEVMVCPVLFSH